MKEKEKIEAEIQKLKKTLTGELLLDLEIQQQIYDLKVKLNPEIVRKPELDDDECLACGA